MNNKLEELNVKKQKLEQEILKYNNDIQMKTNSINTIEKNRAEIKRLRKELAYLCLIIIPMIILASGATLIYLVKCIPLLLSLAGVLAGTAVLNVNYKSYKKQVEELKKGIKNSENINNMNIDYNYYTKLQNELNKINDAIINEQLGYKNTFPPEKPFTKPFTKIKK